MNTDHRLTINLNDRQYTALKKVCEITGQSMCQYIRTMVNAVAYSVEQATIKVEEASQDANVEAIKPDNV